MNIRADRYNILKLLLVQDSSNSTLLLDCAEQAFVQGLVEQSLSHIDRLDELEFLPIAVMNRLEHLRAQIDIVNSNYASAKLRLEVILNSVFSDQLVQDWVICAYGIRAFDEIVARTQDLALSLTDGEEKGLTVVTARFVVLSFIQLNQLTEAQNWIDRTKSNQRWAQRLDGVASLVALDLGDIVSAEQLSQSALNIDEEVFSEAFVVAGFLSLSQFDLDTALGYFGRAELISPRDGRVKIGLGLVKFSQASYAEARAYLIAALDVFPKHVGALNTMIWIDILESKYEEALANARVALTMEPDSAEIHGSIAVVYALQGNQLAAEKTLQIAQQLEPDAFAVQYVNLILMGKHKQSSELESISNSLVVRAGVGQFKPKNVP